jgi:hypothetical protein
VCSGGAAGAIRVHIVIVVGYGLAILEIVFKLRASFFIFSPQFGGVL